MKTFPPLRASFLLLLSCGSACGVLPDQRADFALNQVLYVDVPFTTKAPGDREAFVAPVVDARDPTALPAQEKGFPIQYGGDDFWERPVRDMLGEVLQRQLADSHLFVRIVDRPTAATLVVQPKLVAFTTGAAEAISGRRSFAEVGLQVTVLGEADAAGRRETLLRQTYGARQLSELDLNPVSPYRLIGVALQQSMSKLLADLDGSNVGRSAVPLALPAEAAAPR